MAETESTDSIQLPKPSILSSSNGSMAKAWLKQYFDDSNFPEWTKGSRGITVPLLFPEKDKDSTFDKERTMLCLVCEETFQHPQEEKEYLKHLSSEHRFIIGHVELISDLPSYVSYWRNKFVQPNVVVTDYCSQVKMKMEDTETEQDYFLLSDILPEDKELRMHLQHKKLEHVLEVHEKERNNLDFKRNCFFCRTEFEGCHSKLLDHMAFDHNFSVGQPANLVYIDELLDILEDKLNNLICIYCEKVFKSRDVLKEHMRKKNHKKINPRNSAYDKYYLVNYLEFGKSWEQASKNYEDKPFEEEDLPTGFDSDNEEEEGYENDWSDWRGHLSGAVCFFCPANYTDFNELLNHMIAVHEFDYKAMKCSLKLNFYQQIKLVNYIRRQMHLNQCLFCNDKFTDFEALFHHMKAEDHLKPPQERDEWDQSQYYFPTYDNDNFLCLIEDEEETSKGDEEQVENKDVPVIPQDLQIQESILFQEEYRKQLQPKHHRNKHH